MAGGIGELQPRPHPATAPELAAELEHATAREGGVEQAGAVPEWLMQELDVLCPLDDRTPERRLFKLTHNAVGSAMRRACTAAGIAHFSPHDLRHRYANVKVAEGVPITQLAEQLGRSKKSLTLNTYSHVLIHDG